MEPGRKGAPEVEGAKGVGDMVVMMGSPVMEVVVV